MNREDIKNAFHAARAVALKGMKGVQYIINSVKEVPAVKSFCEKMKENAMRFNAYVDGHKPSTKKLSLQMAILAQNGGRS